MKSIQCNPIGAGCWQAGIYQAVMKASAGVVVAAICLQSPAYAADECAAVKPADVKTASVPVGDLNLSTTEGIRAAKQRIHRAARRLCDQVVDSHSISHQPDYMRCVDAAMSAATAKLEAPYLARSDGAASSGSSAR